MSSNIDDKKLASKIDKNSDNKYPKGLRILAVDDNPVCLKLLSANLRKCGYQFTATTETIQAYEILKKNRDSYDLVLTDVKNNMDGFQFAELVNQMDIPVIIMSADDGTKSVMKGINHGARGYILKPVRYEELKVIWQHVARKDNLRRKNHDPVPSKRQKGTIDERESEIKAQANEENKEELPKRPRYRWTHSMHRKFVNVVQRLGPEHAVPKKILDVMNEPELTRERVASHLQKYRKCLDKLEKNDKTADQEQEKANKIFNFSTTLPCSSNQIGCPSYQNRSMQPSAADTNLISFGANLRAICSSMKTQAKMPQNNFQLSSIGNQMSSTITNSSMMGSTASSSSNQFLGTKQGVNGMRFDSLYSRHTKMENSYYGSYSCSSGGYCNPRGGQVPLADQPMGPLHMLPPSSSYGSIQSQSTGMAQPTNSLPMLPPSSSYGPIHIPDKNHSIRMAQPTNSQPMAPPSSFDGQLERENSIKGKEKVNSFSFDTNEKNMDSLNWDLPYIDQMLMDTDMEIDFPFSSSEDDLVADDDDLFAMFNNNLAPSL